MANDSKRSTSDQLPGFDQRRLVKLMRTSVARCGLDLSKMTVLTEAASGAYATTAVIAALAGARRVYAFARDSRYGSAEEVSTQLESLARLAGVAERITVFSGPLDTVAPLADIVTNSGHLRPIGASLIAHLPAHAVIALMYETWEFRPQDLDIDACRRHGIRVVGVNERHPTVDVFSFLGPLAVKLLHQAGVAVYESRIVLLCDNPFAPYIERGLTGLGALVTVVSAATEIPAGFADVVLMALRPQNRPVIDAQAAAVIADRVPGALLAQYWGDIDRTALQSCGVPVWPPHEPQPGHMAILLSDLGPEAVIRLQTGGLRAAETVFRLGLEACKPGSVAELLPNCTSD